MKEPIENVFKSLVDLRLLLTSNFRGFEPDINIIDEWVQIHWNGELDKYEFKIRTSDATYSVNHYGLPEISLRGQVEEDQKNEIIIDSIFEITRSINNWLINKMDENI